LTIRGQAAPVTFVVEVGGFTDDQVDSTKLPGLAARTTLRRSDFGFGTKLPAFVVGEDVTVQLKILAIRDL
jgi:polyisoprenoid-binding protein YceI